MVSNSTTNAVSLIKGHNSRDKVVTLELSSDAPRLPFIALKDYGTHITHISP